MAAAAPALPQDALSLVTRARELHSSGHLRDAAESYRQTLFTAPRNLAALLGLSLLARQAAQLVPALHMAQAAVAAHPSVAIAWSTLGDALLLLSHTCEAHSAFRRALQLDPKLHTAHFGLGNTVAQQDDFTGALLHFDCAVELAPYSAECVFARAFVHGQLGRHRAAIDDYRRAILLRPAFASAWLNLGVELVADGRDQLAAPCYGQAIQIARQAPADPLATALSACVNLGHLARSRRRFLQAAFCYQHALEIAISHPARLAEVHLAFACLHTDQQQFPQAWQALRTAESTASLASPDIPNTRGILLLAEQSACAPDQHIALAYISLVEEAISSFTQAESLGHKTAGSNRGNALLRLGRVPEALAAHQSSLDRDPHHPGVRYNLALTQLRSGNYAEGWPNYEIRWDFREIHPRPRRFQQPRWRGESPSRLNSPDFFSHDPVDSGLANLEFTTLFLYAEQGLGDTLQFVRYLPLVAKRLLGVQIILEVQPPLLRLLSANLSPLNVRCIASGDPIPPFTHHCPLMSLPAVFATTLETIPNPMPYLHPIHPPEIIDTNASRPITIGLNWAGNPCYRSDRERSTTLETFLPLLALPGIRWISLQKGAPALQLQQIPASLRPIDAASADRDLADTAATVAALDLVLTTDTAIAHLAGALGKPLWLLLPWQADWRWMQHTETTPWHPTARLWRQSSPGNWPELIARVSAALSQLVQPSPTQA